MILSIPVSTNNAAVDNKYLFDGVVILETLKSEKIIHLQKDTQGLPCCHNHIHGEDVWLCSSDSFCSRFLMLGHLLSYDAIHKVLILPTVENGSSGGGFFSISIGSKKYDCLFVC